MAIPILVATIDHWVCLFVCGDGKSHHLQMCSIFAYVLHLKPFSKERKSFWTQLNDNDNKELSYCHPLIT